MKKLFASIFLISIFAFIFSFNSVLAQTGTGGTNSPTVATTLTNPLGSVSTPQALIGTVINSILGIVGSIALLFFVYGGLIWMTSSGNAEKVKKGRDTLVWAAVGLVVIFSAYGLTRYVLTVVTGK